MLLSTSLLKFPSDRFRPIKQTPWGGKQIEQIKSKYLKSKLNHIPTRIGESIEAQTDTFLLKWIDAIEPLSIQVHPKNTDSFLKEHECGKSEAWFVHGLQNATSAYLGFKDGYSKEDIINILNSDNPTDCLYSFVPNKNDYISIPAGCVHSLGAGILVAEPQEIITQKDAVTWRIFDWNRRYNKHGLRDDNGSLREINLEKALSAIDWNLPRGKELEKTLVTHLKHGDRFLGNDYNPFCIELLTQECHIPFKPLIEHQYSIMSVFEGSVLISNATEEVKIIGGECCLIPASNAYKFEIKKQFQKDPCVLVFAVMP